MEWLSQSIAFAKEALPPGKVISPEEQYAMSIKRHANTGTVNSVLQENGKRRKVQGRDAAPLAASTTNSNNGAEDTEQHLWFHPSHPLREDPRVTARRYNHGYDVEPGFGLARETRLKGKGSWSREKTAMEQEPVNYDRVIFAEQVLKPVYHSPYPQMKLSTEVEVISARRVPTKDYAGTVAKSASTRDSENGSRRQERASSERRRMRNGSSKTARERSGIDAISRQANVENGVGSGEASPGLSPLDPSSEANGHETTLQQSVAVPVRHSSRQVLIQTPEASGSGTVPITHNSVNGGLDQYGLEISPEQVSKKRRIGTDEQEYDPDSVQTTARPEKSIRMLPAEQRIESVPLENQSGARRRRRGKMTSGETHDGPIEATRPLRSLWVCDKCFKFMPVESAYVSHIKECSVNFPPGRKVYEKSNWGIWEIDGKVDKRYCQLLSLFGKLFIDHKSICFDVEGFYYYVLTDSHPKRDYVIGYFCKEKFSIDDFNLATILVFPHVQQSGFGRLLMEFSYHLTKDNPSPGTPERPLSVLGARSYESLWMAMLVRYLIEQLLDQEDDAPKTKGKKVDTYMRVWERRKRVIELAEDTDDYLNYEDLRATTDELERQEEQLPIVVVMRAEELARGCHLKTDDLLCLLDALGVLDHQQSLRNSPDDTTDNGQSQTANVTRAIQGLGKKMDFVQWSRRQVAIDFELIVKIVGTWRIPAKPLLDPACCWIDYSGGPLQYPASKKSGMRYM
ncbi:hypothetical protein NliqN6_2823 [Naganishia liquefaciens]|uniref:histone acetyltransferase n=1 Tax=Naganishia liquefaciens TaxID=104408 RepID=A0A8H3TSZ7_9TREE|nr:hypothetical protein NliqN6_2823 [Naganishia liquefaciens]